MKEMVLESWNSHWHNVSWLPSLLWGLASSAAVRLKQTMDHAYTTHAEAARDSGGQPLAHWHRNKWIQMVGRPASARLFWSPMEFRSLTPKNITVRGAQGAHSLKLGHCMIELEAAGSLWAPLGSPQSTSGEDQGFSNHKKGQWYK